MLLLDEPLSALDLKLRQHMRNELRAIQQRVGITFIYITHDQGEALTMSDRIAVMNAGVIEQVGDGRTLYDKPATAFVASFVGENNAVHRPCGERGQRIGGHRYAARPARRAQPARAQGRRPGGAVRAARSAERSAARRKAASRAEVLNVAFEGNVTPPVPDGTAAPGSSW